MNLPVEMREPRRVRTLHQTESGWYYINPRTVDVFATPNNGNTTVVRFTRRQLEQALVVMDKHERN